MALSHEAVVTGGQPAVTDETTEAGFFGPAEIEGMALMARDWERIADALAVVSEVFVKQGRPAVGVSTGYPFLLDCFPQ